MSYTDDVPSSCESCPHFIGYEEAGTDMCMLMDEEVPEEDILVGKPSWCPLEDL